MLSVNVIPTLLTGQGTEVYGSFRQPYNIPAARTDTKAVNCGKAMAPEVNQQSHAKQALCTISESRMITLYLLRRKDRHSTVLRLLLILHPRANTKLSGLE